MGELINLDHYRKYRPLKTVEEENAALTPFQRLTFIYVEINLIGEEPPEPAA